MYAFPLYIGLGIYYFPFMSRDSIEGIFGYEIAIYVAVEAGDFPHDLVIAQ